MRQALSVVAVVLALGACRQASPGCGAVVEEPLDPGSTQHLLPGAPEPHYASDPPTSGPHQAGPVPRGLQPGALPRPLQVAVLEQGAVLVQHRLSPGDDRAEVEALAAADVVVAPNPALRRPVVATAWRHRLECRKPDTAALRAFVAARRGRGPGH